MKLLMVCLGNICRSPIAEGVMCKKIAQLGLNWTVQSAGTESYHIGEPPHQFSQNICSKHDIDISKQKATRFTPSDFEKYDKIFAMAGDVLQEIKNISGAQYDSSKVELFLKSLYPTRDVNVTDPWYGAEEGYAAVYDMIEKGCNAIIEKYRFEL